MNAFLKGLKGLNLYWSLRGILADPSRQALCPNRAPRTKLLHESVRSSFAGRPPRRCFGSVV